MWQIEAWWHSEKISCSFRRRNLLMSLFTWGLDHVNRMAMNKVIKNDIVCVLDCSELVPLGIVLVTEVFISRTSSAWFSSQVRCSNMLWFLVGVFHELRWPSLWSCRSFYPVIQERLPSQEGELCWGKRWMVRELMESHARCILEVAK